MKRLKYILWGLTGIVTIISIIVIVLYFYTFSQGISSNNSDWSLFISLFNCIIMSILTGANVWVFFKLTSAIEANNSERAVKNRLFEAQSIITQMRVNAYNKINEKIEDLINDAHYKRFDAEKMKNLVKLSETYATSFLFCDKSIEEKSLLMLPLNDIINFNKGINSLSDLSEDQSISLIKHLVSYRRFIETYIIGQLILDADTKGFIKDKENRESLDYSILYVSTLMGFSKNKINDARQ